MAGGELGSALGRDGGVSEGDYFCELGGGKDLGDSRGVKRGSKKAWKEVAGVVGVGSRGE